MTKTGEVKSTVIAGDEKKWSGIRQIAAGGVYFCGVTKDNTIKLAGHSDDEDKLFSEETVALIEQWSDVAMAVLGSGYIVAVVNDNAVVKQGSGLSVTEDLLAEWKGRLKTP